VAARTPKRPTKLRVKDSNAIQSLLEFGLNHRAAVADQCLKRFRQVETAGDRISLAAECFVCMIANVEDLEKAYFALKRKAAGERGSFFQLYTNTGVSEPQPKDPIAAKERSARVMLRELRETNLNTFRSSLGLPVFEEWKRLGRSPAGMTRRDLRKRFNDEARGLRKRMIQAVTNRATKRLMNMYNKSKHGFVALHVRSPLTLLMVEKAYGTRRHVCWVQCMPFEIKEASVAQLVDNTKTLALTMRTLLTLWARIQMQPPSS